MPVQARPSGPGLFALPHFRVGISQQTLQQIALDGAMIMPVLAYLLGLVNPRRMIRLPDPVAASQESLDVG